MKRKRAPRMGRINYLNVLPIYHPLESGIIPHNFELVSGPPAILNDMMSAGDLDISSCSCFEYARRPERYYLVRDLSIGSRGPVMSVLLLSALPPEQLAGKEILISGESHTSVALLRILLRDVYKIETVFSVGNVSATLHGPDRPVAFLAIGDEALRLRNHPDYPYCVDLAEAWRQWTGLPFIFGLWVISRSSVERQMFDSDPGEILRSGRDWGMSNIDIVIDLTAYGCPLSREELRRYYTEGLLYNLGDEELKGLNLFYDKLARHGLVSKIPPMEFY